MKLAQLILPLLDNNGESLFYQHEQLKHDLLKAWGGYTVQDGAGCWKNVVGKIMAEQVRVYSIAMSITDAQKLRLLALELAAAARQESVMIILPDGTVEFVQPMKEEVRYG